MGERSRHTGNGLESSILESAIRLGIIPIIIIFYVSAAFQFDFTPDETYIFLRYASNVVVGNGFAFNPGFTALDIPGVLWVLILAAAKAGGIDPYVAAKILDLLFASLALLVLYRLAAAVTGSHFLALIAVGLAAFDPFYLNSAVAGTGVALEILLLLLTILYVYRTEYVLAAFVSAAFTLLRPEGILLFLMVQTDNLLNTTRLAPVRKITTASTLLFAGVVAPWIGYNLLEYGTVLPSGDALRIGIPIMVASLGGSIPAQSWLTQILPASSFLAGMVVALRSGSPRRVVLEVAPVCLVAGLLGAAIMFRPDLTARYLPWILPLVALLGTWGMKKMMDFWKLGWRRAMIVAAIVVVPTVGVNSALYQTQIIPLMEDWSKEIDRGLKPIAYWLRSHSEPGSIIEATDPGYLGYVSGRVVIREKRDHMPHFVLDRSPDSTRLSAPGVRPVFVQSVFRGKTMFHYTLYQRDP